MTKLLTKGLATLGALAIAGMMTAPATQAGEAEIALLTSYIGDWRGEGRLSGGNRGEPFRCRLNINKGNQARINYAGRCSLVDMNLSVSGTIAYNDQTRRYEAAMSSNAGFTGMAMGRQQGDRISFDLREQQRDRAGSDVRIGSRILLDGEAITVDFEVEFNNSGEVLTASVPFRK
ncbi:DUF1794 domain-containing protein [Arsenicitalea aurantiaca]|uniref:DUF1794 domain-containing protein n=1 Tax=Arsenicitalea aurantiaca TaxID=1783274 RepID=A0A433XL19_9HYPH|nr:heme-binding beta-barrel domain-containing protein [Arsenicitalea aurantiaca]RUT34753.1 DUF1794 domain-containing protein [Arsenicitalea aurantiaca]